MEPNRIGQVFGTCTIRRLIQHGGMSSIYLAEQADIGREVAVKVMSPVLSSDPTFYERFQREVKTTARLQHPHIIPIYDVGLADENPYIVMAYIPGGSLEMALDTGLISLETTARLVRQVASALDFAHKQGVIHRDIKPANILLDAQQNAILTDFGIARILAATRQITRDELIGTPSYLAPEMITEQHLPSSACDIYGLGVTIFQMLTGDYPFKGNTAVQLMWAHINEPAPLAQSLRPDLPSGVDAVLQKALAKEPGDRYHTVLALADDLDSVAAGQAPAIAEASPAPTIVAASPRDQVHRLEDAVRRVIDEVVRITRPNGGSGSGVYLPDGKVLTCAHVVDGAEGIYVQFRTGEQVEARVLALDTSVDLALLTLLVMPDEAFTPVQSDLLFEFREEEPGEPLAAIGHPLGLNWAVTGGHFNGLRFPGEEALEMFGITLSTPLVQVDVTMNPGNSGGPLIDQRARLVGIADSIINPALANNIGFAISGQVAYDFWQAHQSDETPLIPYSCGHHHLADLSFCPFTGKPAKPVEIVPLPSEKSIRYTCGHHHPFGLEFCPLTGKPITPLNDLPAQHKGDAPPTDQEPPVTCPNCGKEYDPARQYCPTCGRPNRG